MSAHDGIWTTRDKRTIHISEMSDAHLENSLRMLERNALRHIQQTIQAIQSAHDDYAELIEEGAEPKTRFYEEWVDAMRAELTRRKRCENATTTEPR